MSGCASALASVFGRCASMCLSCCRGRRGQEAPTETGRSTDGKGSNQDDQTRREQPENPEVELKETGKDANFPDSVSRLYSQMQKELAASLENLTEAGRD